MYSIVLLCTFTCQEHHRTSNPNDHISTSQQDRQLRRRQRRNNNQSSASSTPLDHDPDSIVAHHTIPSKPTAVVSSSSRSHKPIESLRHHSDSDGESERLPVKPWSPSLTIDGNHSSTPSFLNTTDEKNANDDSSSLTSPQMKLALRAVFEMIMEDLDKFVYTPAPNGLGDIQCRITRDKRGMEKGLFPTYYMHVERPGDGKKV
jgi:hypothetical protein